MTQENEIIAFGYVFYEGELFRGLEWAEREVGLEAVSRALKKDRELATYHLCLASSTEQHDVSKAGLERLAGVSA